jgi:octanoyl-[GcvH]:protein N-octanoyltransferase
MADRVAWQVECIDAPVEVGAQLAREAAMLARWSSHEQPRALIWHGGPALVISQADRHLPHCELATRDAAEQGWPVFVRTTGGAAVALAPGVINLALFTTLPDPAPSLAAGFELICRPVIAALARFGVAAGTGHAPGAFCDGRFNVLVGDRKIAGTAQRRTRRQGRSVLLAHASVLADGNLEELTQVVARFYERAGAARPLTALALTCLAACLPDASATQLPARFAATLSEVLGSGND